MDWHKRLGYVALGLLVLRVFWGFFGSETARFSRFVKGPRAIVAYLRGLFSKGEPPVVGHNPLGGWSVVILLLLLISEVKLGLFAQDTDGIESGPLAYLVSYDVADLARRWHHTVFNLLLAFIAVHLLAIGFYALVKRENLIGPMLTGARRFHAEVTAPKMAPVWRLGLGLIIAGALAWWVSIGLVLPKH